MGYGYLALVADTFLDGGAGVTFAGSREQVAPPAHCGQPRLRSHLRLRVEGAWRGGAPAAEGALRGA